jgi:hypothetical protein
MKVYSLDRLHDLVTISTPSAEDEYFSQIEEPTAPVTRQWSGLVKRTVNYIYPDGRIVSRTQNIFSSRRCDSVVNIKINK